MLENSYPIKNAAAAWYIFASLNYRDSVVVEIYKDFDNKRLFSSIDNKLIKYLEWVILKGNLSFQCQS